MTQAQILYEFSKLPLSEQLEVIQAAFRITVQQFQKAPPAQTASPQDQLSLADAATFLLDDYLTDPELTAFQALDGEPFYATR